MSDPTWMGPGEAASELARELDEARAEIDHRRAEERVVQLAAENKLLREMADRYLEIIQDKVREADEAIKERGHYQSLFEVLLNRVHIAYRLREKGNEMSKPSIAPPPRFDLDRYVQPIANELDARLRDVHMARAIIEETIQEIESRGETEWAQAVMEKCHWLTQPGPTPPEPIDKWGHGGNKPKE